jgi:hypothetical protein
MTSPLPKGDSPLPSLPTGARRFDSSDVPPPVRGPLPSFVTEVRAEEPKAPVITSAKKTASASNGFVKVIRNNHELIIDPSRLPKPPEGLSATEECAWAWDNLTPSQFGMWNTLAWEKRRIAEGRPVETRSSKLGPLACGPRRCYQGKNREISRNR